LKVPATQGAAASRLRPMVEADIPGCRGVFDAAEGELYERHGRPWLPADAPIMDRLLRHLLTSDPGLAWVAEAGRGRAATLTGFVMAIRRERLWFLSFLFVRPEAQSAGLGRRLLERTMPADAPVIVLATCVDALQPVSTGLYARYGLVPRVPILTLLGQARPDALPGVPRSVEPVSFDELAEGEGGHARLAETVDALDSEVVGFTRPGDHAYWRLEGRRGTLFVERRSGTRLGYAYASPGGRNGPVVVSDAELLPAILGHAIRGSSAASLQVLVPGVAAEAVVPLLRAGLRLEGSPGVWCATRASVDLERYLPAGYALP
jgi:GNAT superfamily N-acetyltransferase